MEGKKSFGGGLGGASFEASESGGGGQKGKVSFTGKKTFPTEKVVLGGREKTKSGRKSDYLKARGHRKKDQIYQRGKKRIVDDRKT